MGETAGLRCGVLCAVQIGARTPEQLGELLEDAFIVGDERALEALFEPQAVVAVEGRVAEARRDELAAARVVWSERVSLAPGPRCVVQAGSTALMVADTTVAVMRRTPDGFWRYAIALFANETRGDPR